MAQAEGRGVRRRVLALLVLGLAVWASPVAAQKPTPPPTPAPVAPPVEEAPVVELTKAPEPPTPTPEPLPSATPEALLPTATAVWPTETVTVASPTATPDVTTVIATLPRPTVTQSVTPTALPTVLPGSTPTVDTTATPAQWPTLPGWVWPVAGGIGLLILWLIVRFVGYTRQDLAMKRRMIAEDTATRVAAHRRDVAAQLQATDAWQHLLGQIATDALGQPVRIVGDTLPYINADDLAFTALDAQGVRYCFTVASPRKARPQGEVYRLDNPETQAEVSAVWHYLAAQRLQGTLPAVPRQAMWILVVQRPITPQVRRRANRRWWLGVALGVLLLIAASTLVGARLVQAHLATPTPVVATVTLVNTTGETVTLWTLENEPVCVVCPEAALLPEESRALDVTPGPLLWEVVRAPFGDFYTAYRIGLVETYVSPGATAQDTVITLTKMPFTNGR
jgi:hypothetical protein